VAAYMLGIVAAGFWGRRKATTQDQFLVAGRSVGPWLYSGTLAAIVLGGASTVGGVKLGYQYGISGMWFVFMFGLGIILLSSVLVGRILDLKLYTMPELLARRYGSSAQICGGLVMAVYDPMVSVTATIAVGSAVEVIAGIPRTPAILVSSLVMVTYSVLGGMWSLTLTDIVQFVIKTVGILLILLPGAILHAGGLSAMSARLPADFFSLTGMGTPKILSFFILYFLGIIIGQDVWQRVFTARDVGVARKGGIAVGLYCLLYALAGALIGMAGHTFLPALSDAEPANHSPHSREQDVLKTRDSRRKRLRAHEGASLCGNRDLHARSARPGSGGNRCRVDRCSNRPGGDKQTRRPPRPKRDS
jgi:SSS family solute:Na+ symporter